MKILTLEAETPHLVDAARAKGQLTNADHYAAALKFRSPGINIQVAEPYRKCLSQQNFNDVDGVVFTGSGVAWSTDAPEAAPLRAAGEMVFDAGRTHPMMQGGRDGYAVPQPVYVLCVQFRRSTGECVIFASCFVGNPTASHRFADFHKSHDAAKCHWPLWI